jgi:hypothetical protein
MARSGGTVPASGGTVLPELLVFYKDVTSDTGKALVGWRIVAWGLVLPDGSAESLPVEGLGLDKPLGGNVTHYPASGGFPALGVPKQSSIPASATLWPSVEVAALGLRARVHLPDHQRRLLDLPGRAMAGAALAQWATAIDTAATPCATEGCRLLVTVIDGVAWHVNTIGQLSDPDMALPVTRPDGKVDWVPHAAEPRSGR